jgi:hypothetical protein
LLPCRRFHGPQKQGAKEVRFQNQRMSMWYDTPDAPAPSGSVLEGSGVAVTVAVSRDPSNNVEVQYRVNRGKTEVATAKWLRDDRTGKTQYFLARLPTFRVGDTVEYTPICRCAGRQVPSQEEAKRFASSFHVTGPDAKAVSIPIERAVSPTEPTRRLPSYGSGPSARLATAPSAIAVSSALRSDTREPGDGQPGDGPPGGNGDRPSLEVVITSPAQGATLSGPSNGEPVTIAGTVAFNVVTVSRVIVRLGRAPLGRATLSGDASTGEMQWSITGRGVAPGVQSIRAEATADSRTATAEITVNLPDTVPPQVAILEPINMQPVDSTEEHATVSLKVNAWDYLGVASVDWRLDADISRNPLETNPVRYGDSYWHAIVTVPPVPLGNHTITVRCTDLAGNFTERAVTVQVIDQSPPHYEILEPRDGQRIIRQPTETVLITVRGRAWDLQGGMIGGQAAVEWSLNGSPPFQRTTTTDNWATWQTQIFISDYGFYIIYLRFTDRDGNFVTQPLNIEVVSFYEPKNLEERLNPRAYLESLLMYARDHVREPSQGPLSTGKLQEVFYQPFGKLAQPLFDLASQPVNQLRVPVEVLRQYVRSDQGVLLAHWGFDEGTGSTASDSSGNGNDGTLATSPSTPSWTTGRNGGSALSFDGIDDYVTVSGDQAIGKDGSDFSVTFSMLLRQGGNGKLRSIIGSGTGTFTLFLVPTENRIGYGISTDQPSQGEGRHSKSLVGLNSWVHVDLVKRGSELELYLDGTLDSRLKLKGRSTSRAGPIYIGSMPAAGFLIPPIDGSLDDIRLYSLALTPQSVIELASNKAAAVATNTLAAQESKYRQMAYEALLKNSGTSYEEIRLARGADAGVRKALADRLGISLSAVEPDHLDELLLEPSDITEEALERIFGLVDTTKDPLDSTRPSRALLDWQLDHLKAVWMEQEYLVSLRGTTPPAIDPDLVGLDDMRNDITPNPALDIWNARFAWVRNELFTLKSKRVGAPTLVDEVDQVVAYGLGGAGKLVELDEKYKQGADIETDLHALSLTIQTFTYLLRMRQLAGTGTLTDTEWEDIYGILTQVRKRQETSTWREEERQNQISLSPQFFRVSSGAKSLPAWRATEEARRDWEDLLESRISQQQSLKDALQASVDVAEQSTLPVLRNALVSTIGGVEIGDQIADRLSENLLIDLKGGGSQKTTRILQAIETVQAVLFSLRTARFETNHPAFSWELQWTGSDTQNVEEHFDAEWKWMGTHATWGAAMQVFLYPENILLPQLRDRQTHSFQGLIKNLRVIRNFTPERAREEASNYLNFLKDSVTQGGLAAIWKFDEGAGNVAVDVSGNENNGTLINGPSWIADESGNGLSFDGVDDFVRINNSPSLEVGRDGSDFTVAFSMLLRGSPTAQRRWIMHKGGGGLGENPAGGTFRLAMHSNDTRLDYEIGTDAAAAGEGGTSSAQIHASNWTHIACVKAGRSAQLYINGILDSSLALSGQSIGNPGPLFIGGYWPDYYTPDRGIDATLRGVRLYKLALSAEAVAVLSVSSITEELSNTELNTRRNYIQALVRVSGTDWNRFAMLQEILYFVPLHIALRLQNAGEYVSALDWFQTVYGYNLPEGEQKVYYPLQLEQNLPPDLTQGPHWLMDSLNPHTIAGRRANSSNLYTRFTLISLARCFLEYADSQFTRDTDESVAEARSLFMTVRRLLSLPELETPESADPAQGLLPNPVLDSLRMHAELQLSKLHQGRNIAGIKRQIDIAVPPPALVGLPAVGSGARVVLPGAEVIIPTPYRYSVLIDRAKQLVNIAQQIEAEYLATLEKYDAAAYKRFQANQALDLASAQVKLEDLRAKEAEQGVTVATAQRGRSQAQVDGYKQLINEGLNRHEREMLANHSDINTYRNLAARAEAAVAIGQAIATAGSGGLFGTGFGGGWSGVAVVAAESVARAEFASAANNAEADLQRNTLYASQERREQEWRFQQSIAEQDVLIGNEQITLAEDHRLVANQERAIAQQQSAQARAMVDFLDNQFTSSELYDWMSGVLAGVYSYFLQQATATARLAQGQLAFERQEIPPAYVRSDYWTAPEEDVVGTPQTGFTPDRRGLTGSARLLQDIYQLDQYAFETNKRKLQLTQTLSLARLVPFEFQQFRETGNLSFATTLDLFDRGFPGHYLRLIKRVRTSVVALIPPTQGIRTTLMASGTSRVVIGPDVFQIVVVRRAPELVALTSPMNATGLFELDAQSDMLLPFEAMGVDMLWQLEMPKAANPFDYSTIADILITIEYTALNSFDYREQVIQRLDRKVIADRFFSFRNEFPDQWYDLHNPNQTDTPMTVHFRTMRGDFPANIEDLKIQQLALYFAGAAGKFELDVTNLTFIPEARPQLSGGGAHSIGGLISTRRGNAGGWVENLLGPHLPVGEWELTLPNTPEIQDRFSNEEITDILFAVTYSALTPVWPA